MRRGRLAAAVLLAALLLCGCSRLYEGSYTVVTEHVESSGSPEAGEWTYEVHTFAGMKNAVQDLVNAASEYGVIRAVDYTGSVSDDISRACLDVTRESPLGAYAVEYMTHSVERLLSYYEVAVHISYKLSAEEMSLVRSVPSLADMYRLVDASLETGAEKLAVQIVTLAITERTLITYVENYYRTHPAQIAAQPEVSVSFYPSEDYVQKIVTFDFQYPNPRETSADMLQALNEAAAALAAGWAERAPEEQALLGCAAVSAVLPKLSRGRTAYDVLVKGQGNSEGCAMAYQLLCTLCGLESQVVSGRLNSETHYWNILRLDREYYHVDTSACVGHDLASGFLKKDRDLWGSYWWDVDKYPVCQGQLSTAQVQAQIAARQQPQEPNDEGIERAE